MPTIGNRGARLDLLIKKGTTLGPFPVAMRSGSGVPIDITGCVIRGRVAKAHGAARNYPFTVVITDATAGKFAFSIPPDVTATIPSGSKSSDPQSLYVWDMEIQYLDGTVKPLFYGEARLAAMVA